MANQKLTAGRIRDFQCPPDSDQSFLWDAEVPGLGIRATSGAKVFIFQSRLNRKSIRVKIGDCRSWPIDSNDPASPGARQEARRLQGLIDKGIDPRIDRKERLAKTIRQQAESKRETVLFSDAWAAYIESRRDNWSERHYEDHLKMIEPGGRRFKKGKGKIKAGLLAEFLPLRLADLTPEKVESWAKREAPRRGTRARLAFTLLRAFLNWCDQESRFIGIASPSVCSTRIKKDILPKAKAKDDCLQKEQLNAWFAAIRNLPNPVISAYLQTLLLTGARRGELAGLLWADIDFRWNSLTIHDKVEGVRTIPLTPYAASILAQLPRRNQFVFSSHKAASGRMEEPRIAHNKALAVAGIEGLTIHGLRRSFGTLSEWVECPIGVVAQIMGHKPSAIAEKHYRRRPLDLLRMWHEKIEAWILNEAGIKQPETVKTGLRVVAENVL